MWWKFKNRIRIYNFGFTCTITGCISLSNVTSSQFLINLISIWSVDEEKRKEQRPCLTFPLDLGFPVCFVHFTLFAGALLYYEVGPWLERNRNNKKVQKEIFRERERMIIRENDR
jgi:hypothetical protein